MFGLSNDKKVIRLFFVLTFLILNCFAPSSVYGSPSTTCNSSSYHTYACDGDTRYYCVRSTISSSSGSYYSYWWKVDTNCADSGQVCSSGSCVACTTTSYPDSCVSSTLYYCLSNQKTSVACTYGSCRSTTQCAECSTTSYPTTCSAGKISYCGSGVKYTVDCAYGACKNSTTCASCNSTSGCSAGYTCVGGSCTTNCDCGALLPGKECDKGTVSDLIYTGTKFTWKCNPDAKCANAVTCEHTGTYTHTCDSASGYGCVDPGSGCSYVNPHVPYGVPSTEYSENYTCLLTVSSSSVCCKPSTCDSEWPGSLCISDFYCNGTINDNRNATNCANSSDTCCTEILTPGCEAITNSYPPYGSGPNAYCKDSYSNSCYRCGNGGPNFAPSSSCRSYTNSGTDGSCGGSNGQTVCSTDLSATCGAGNATTASFDGSTWSWSCNGIKASSCPASVNNASCTATKLADINGVCGVSQGTSSCFAPTADLCSTGSPSAVSTNTSTNVFSWSCSKQCSGTAPNCTSTRLVINGSCGAADGGNFTSTPTELCAVGTASAVAEPTTTSYTWSCNRNCNGNIDYCSAVHDLAPNLASTVLKNASGTVVAVEVGGINHSCDANFGSSKTNIWTITASDANGLADVKEISLRFRSASNTYTYGPKTAVNGVVSFTIDTSLFNAGTYNVEVLIDDIHSPDPVNRGWLDTGRDFKIWDCQVKVNGTIYDNSANLACNNSNTAGFTQTIPVDVDPFEFVYGDRFDGSTKEVTVSSPNFRNPETLTWQREYFLDAFDEDDSNFSGVFKTLKINDVCLPSNSFTVPRNHVNAYDVDPTINIKYGAIMDQESWFRVTDGTVISKVEARNYVPVTCVDDCMTAINGIVWSKNVNTPKSNDESLWSEIQPKTDPNTYTALKYDIKSGLNIGTTFVVDTTYGKTSLNWSEIKDTREIIFIEGDFTIDEDINISPSDYLLIIVSGKITILPNVNLVEGMFFANTTIEASGDSDTQLIINGSLYGKNGVSLSRTYTKKRDNNTNPAVRVVYDPNLIFKLPQRMWETYENWRME